MMNVKMLSQQINTLKTNSILVSFVAPCEDYRHEEGWKFSKEQIKLSQAIEMQLNESYIKVE